MKYRKFLRKYKLLILLSSFILLFTLVNKYCFNSKINNYYNKDNIVVHYIDVGQGDCILVQVNNQNLLIDSGPKQAKKNLLKYLNSLNITNLNYVIATHPHDDHIGNMADIINKYNVGKFYAPKITSNTKSFEKMVDSLKYKNLKINIIKAGISTIDLGKNVTVSVFSPIKESYENLNNYSAVIKIQYKNISFLFVGDAEKEIEDSLKNNHDLKSDVLKIGHHGSSTSSSLNFIKLVNPSIAVISVGSYNDYNHPNCETLNTLTNQNIKIFRTDKDKNIVLYSDGNFIKKSS